MATETKHQHYVPQFYLRQFADEKEQLWVYDKVADRVFRTSVRNVAGERYFYDSDEIAAVTGDRQLVEKFLSALETAFRDKIERLLRRLRAGGFIRLHPETRHVIAVFAAVQLIRTKENRIALRQISEQLLTFLSKFPDTDALAAEARDSLSDDALRESQARALLDIPSLLQMAAILEGHIWVIARHRPLQTFYTSDVPITRRGHVKRPFRGNDGIASNGVEVQVPLAHDYCLALYERTHFAKYLRYDGRVLDMDTEQQMIYYRQFPVKFSSRYVFCRDNDFALARQICTEEPHWRKPDRKRITSSHDPDEPLQLA